MWYEWGHSPGTEWEADGVTQGPTVSTNWTNSWTQNNASKRRGRKTKHQKKKNSCNSFLCFHQNWLIQEEGGSREKNLLCLPPLAARFPAWVSPGETTTGSWWWHCHQPKVILACLCSWHFFFYSPCNSLLPVEFTFYFCFNLVSHMQGHFLCCWFPRIHCLAFQVLFSIPF